MSAQVPAQVAGDSRDAAWRDPSTRFGWGYGRSGLIVPLIVAAFSTYLMIGVATMEVPEGVDPPGPTLVPLLVAIVGYVVAALHAIAIVRNPEPAVPPLFDEQDEVPDELRREAEEAAKVPYKFFSDWVSIAWAAGGFLAFVLVLPFLGWILGATLLFWTVARAMGSRRALFDLSLGLVLGSVSYLCFGTLLGLNLPSGLLGGWS